MKKLTALIVTVIFVLSFAVMSVNAEAEKVYGFVSWFNSVEKVCGIETENGNTIEVSYGENEPKLGVKGFYTIEDGTIIDFEELPEANSEVGYFLGSETTILGETTLYIYTTELKKFSCSSEVSINGERVDSNSVASTIGNYKGVVSFNINNDQINELNFVEQSKQSVSQVKLNANGTFDGLRYNITENTTILQMESNSNVFECFKPGYTYSFDVMSYDKDYNARLVVINDAYFIGNGLYTGYATTVDGLFASVCNIDGTVQQIETDDRDILSNIQVGTVIEYRCDGLGIMTEASEVTNYTELNNCTYNKENGLFGEYSLSDISFLEFKYNNREAIVGSSKCFLSTRYVYDGRLYNFSNGEKAIYITSKTPSDGNPIVDFSARYDNESQRISFSADLDKNGYTGDGTVYMAIYNKKGNLVTVRSFDLNEDGGEDIIYDELYDINTYEDALTYTIRGFVWESNLEPMYPCVDVTIR